MSRPAMENLQGGTALEPCKRLFGNPAHTHHHIPVFLQDLPSCPTAEGGVRPLFKPGLAHARQSAAQHSGEDAMKNKTTHERRIHAETPGDERWVIGEENN